MALLEAHELVKFYGRRCVVKGVNFEVNAGEVVGLLGPNGAGKTTSFKMTTGQVGPNGGKVIFNGHDVTHLPMYKRARLGMGYLCQETSVFRKLSVEQNILAILEMMPRLRTMTRALTRAERWERTDKVLAQFGLLHIRKNTAARLSGGEKRRLEIARCLVCEPLLILLDEPFTGIDPKTIADIQQIVIALRKQGIGILLTDHNVREALKITTRSYLIKAGEVCTHGTPYQIINDPIAINEYLGAGFNDDSFARNPDELPKPAPQEVPAAPPPADAPQPAAGTLDELMPLVDDGTSTLAAPTPPKTTTRKSVGQALLSAGQAAAPLPLDVKPRTSEAVARVAGADKPVVQKPVVAQQTAESNDASGSSLQAQIWSEEKPERLVEHLKSPQTDLATAALIKKGNSVVPILLAALERRDVELRRQIKEILQRILQRPVVFDPFAPEAVRMQQLAALRDTHGRKAS